MKELPDIIKKVPKNMRKLTEAIAESSIKDAEKEAAQLLLELNNELGTDVTQTFNTHILISEYYELESDGSEKQMNEELSKKVLFKLKLCKKENDKKGTSN